MAGLLVMALTATEFTILSEPTSFGLSITMLIFVFRFLPTSSASTPKYFLIESISGPVTGGTTDEMMAAFTSFASTLAKFKKS